MCAADLQYHSVGKVIPVLTIPVFSMGANAGVGRKLDLSAGLCLVAHPGPFHTFSALASSVTGNSGVVPFQITTSSTEGFAEG